MGGPDEDKEILWAFRCGDSFRGRTTGSRANTCVPQLPAPVPFSLMGKEAFPGRAMDPEKDQGENVPPELRRPPLFLPVEKKDEGHARDILPPGYFSQGYNRSIEKDAPALESNPPRIKDIRNQRRTLKGCL